MPWKLLKLTEEAETKNTHLSGPLYAVESCPSLPKAFDPYFERIGTGSQLVRQFGDQQLLEFRVRSCTR